MKPRASAVPILATFVLLTSVTSIAASKYRAVELGPDHSKATLTETLSWIKERGWYLNGEMKSRFEFDNARPCEPWTEGTDIGDTLRETIYLRRLDPSS